MISAGNTIVSTEITNEGQIAADYTSHFVYEHVELLNTRISVNGLLTLYRNRFILIARFHPNMHVSMFRLLSFRVLLVPSLSDLSNLLPCEPSRSMNYVQVNDKRYGKHLPAMHCALLSYELYEPSAKDTKQLCAQVFEFFKKGTSVR